MWLIGLKGKSTLKLNLYCAVSQILDSKSSVYGYRQLSTQNNNYSIKSGDNDGIR